MFYAFSVLFFVLGLSTGIPALLQWRRMEVIRRSSDATFGVVRAVGRSNLGWNFLGEVGRSARPLVAFQVNDKEYEVEMTDTSGFLNRRYNSGETVEVVYQKGEPWNAYLQHERTLARRDQWKALGEIFLAAVLWAIGAYLGIPV